MQQDTGSMQQDIGSMQQSIGLTQQDTGSTQQSIGLTQQDVRINKYALPEKFTLQNIKKDSYSFSHLILHLHRIY